MNDALVKQVSFLERQCWRNAQYSRRECVEIIGIHTPIEHSDLEKTVCKVLHIGADIFEDKIESYHNLNKKSYRIIVTFSRNKDCELVMMIQKDLKDLNPTDLDFPEGTQLFINNSLCPECKKTMKKNKSFLRFLLLMA